MKKKVNVQIDSELKKELDNLKIIPRETYRDVIKRLVDYYNQKN